MLFEFLASNDEGRRIASRKAVAVATKRLAKFENFLSGAQNEDEHEARLSMIEGDLREMVAAVAEEFGVNEDHLFRAVNASESLQRKEARKPKMCPYHSEVVDISLGTGDAQAGFNSMAQHAYSENSCKGSFDGRCNFKPAMVNQSFWDEKAEQAEQRRLERDQQVETQQAEPVEEITEPVADAPEAAPVENVVPITEQLADAPSAVADSGADLSMAAKTAFEYIPHEGPQAAPSGPSTMPCPRCSRPVEMHSPACPHCGLTDAEAAAYGEEHERNVVPGGNVFAKKAEALKTVDVDAGGETASPKMDKRKWTPQNVNFLDVEMDGSPVPTHHQDIMEPVNYGNDFKDQTNAVTEHQDVTEGTELSHSGQGGSFGKGNQANPVTSAEKVANGPFHCSACGAEGTYDPEKGNPYREVFAGDQCKHCGATGTRAEGPAPAKQD